VHEAVQRTAATGVDQSGGGHDVARRVQLDIGPTLGQAGHRGQMYDGLDTIERWSEIGGSQVDLMKGE
jgi:hypothetical protein